MSRAELADAANAYLYNRYGRRAPMLDSRRIGDYERGRTKWPTALIREALRSVLGVATDAELGFYCDRTRPRPAAENQPFSEIGSDSVHRATAAREHDGVPSAPSYPTAGGNEADEMRRRMALASVLSLGIGSATQRVRLGTLLDDLADLSGHDALAESWQNVAREYGLAYLTTPRRGLLDDMSVDLIALRRVIARTSVERARLALNSSAARLGGLLAMTCTDLGYTAEARRLWYWARERSDSSDSPETRQWVRGQEALLGLYAGRPLPAILAVVEDGLHATEGARSGGTADLLAAKAQALAIQGQTRAATEVLQRLQGLVEQLPSAITSSNSSIFGWPEHRLRHTESYVYTATGARARAMRAQEQALALYPAGRVVSRCQIEMHRATCLVASGDIRHGIKHAEASWQDLPADKRGMFVTAVANTVLGQVPAAERRRRDVADFRAQLTATSSRYVN